MKKTSQPDRRLSILQEELDRHGLNMPDGELIPMLGRLAYEMTINSLSEQLLLFDSASRFGTSNLYTQILLNQSVNLGILEVNQRDAAGQKTEVQNERQKPTIGIITALPKEFAAVKVLLEDPREYFVPEGQVDQSYVLGRISATNGDVHFLVLSLAEKSNNISTLLQHFPSVSSVIMVGIAAGVPNPEKPDEHVRLGDIVISNEQGIIQYDFDKQEITETPYRSRPRPPSPTLLQAVHYLEAFEFEDKRPWLDVIKRGLDTLRITRPSEATDILVNSSNLEERIPHPSDPKRIKDQPKVQTGSIASSNKLLNNPFARDQLRDKFNIKAVEMEASSIVDVSRNQEVDYLVVRGICDYADEIKVDVWQDYAAVVAAGYTRALLESFPKQVSDTEYVEESIPHLQPRQPQPINLISFTSSQLQDAFFTYFASSRQTYPELETPIEEELISVAPSRAYAQAFFEIHLSFTEDWSFPAHLPSMSTIIEEAVRLMFIYPDDFDQTAKKFGRSVQEYQQLRASVLDRYTPEEHKQEHQRKWWVTHSSEDIPDVQEMYSLENISLSFANQSIDSICLVDQDGHHQLALKLAQATVTWLENWTKYRHHISSEKIVDKAQYLLVRLQEQQIQRIQKNKPSNEKKVGP